MAVEASFVAEDVDGMNHDDVDRLAALMTNQQASVNTLHTDEERHLAWIEKFA